MIITQEDIIRVENGCLKNIFASMIRDSEHFLYHAHPDDSDGYQDAGGYDGDYTEYSESGNYSGDAS